MQYVKSRDHFGLWPLWLGDFDNAKATRANTKLESLCFAGRKGHKCDLIDAEASVEALFKSHKDLGNTSEPWFVNRNTDKL